MGAFGAFISPPPGRWPDTKLRVVSNPQDQKGAYKANVIFQNEGGFSSTGNLVVL